MNHIYRFPHIEAYTVENLSGVLYCSTSSSEDVLWSLLWSNTDASLFTSLLLLPSWWCPIDKPSSYANLAAPPKEFARKARETRQRMQSEESHKATTPSASLLPRLQSYWLVLSGSCLPLVATKHSVPSVSGHPASAYLGFDLEPWVMPQTASTISCLRMVGLQIIPVLLLAAAACEDNYSIHTMPSIFARIRPWIGPQITNIVNSTRDLPHDDYYGQPTRSAKESGGKLCYARFAWQRRKRQTSHLDAIGTKRLHLLVDGTSCDGRHTFTGLRLVGTPARKNEHEQRLLGGFLSLVCQHATLEHSSGSQRWVEYGIWVDFRCQFDTALMDMKEASEASICKTKSFLIADLRQSRTFKPSLFHELDHICFPWPLSFKMSTTIQQDYRPFFDFWTGEDAGTHHSYLAFSRRKASSQLNDLETSHLKQECQPL
ncbi:uncharacterized protein MYCFIDRAFT_180150 [Pseudocercospora fijiensis CIRAD86]|uniref:Uncharacterized protein n=1 Tax=Pseudocercospora fijiensis (strain CIRAD86) TaxID=383855 RepID=M2ZYF6_PSEFD|nr:uncharacterized protein MYCFIDRAFT_180150 [Pseudocercospora fijiensis CIRAD86]EME77146.1 hypothetical protein MYCFIDRAFT_180150 [Pseudocercospora fijiensis CIRAD86]